MDFSGVIPPGMNIVAANLSILLNTSPTQPSTDFTQGEPVPLGRQVWCDVEGGVAGTDYQVVWTVTDSGQNVWRRTALLLCAATS